MQEKITFNKPYLSGNELRYVEQAIHSGKTSGNGFFTQKCHDFFQRRYGFEKVLLTTSCTHALEMAALLIDVQPGDEVIIPSYTFVSCANAFILRGAKVVFADSQADHPNIEVDGLEELITQKTKAILVVHYAGFACDMEKVLSLADEHDIYVIEDVAHAVDSYFDNKPLGSFGHLATFSFHETKNIISGEGGMLVINDHRLQDRAEIVWEKGTNRAAFWRGEVDKYTWVDIGSSYLPSELIAAFLYGQLESLEDIQLRRIAIWNNYYEGLKDLAITQSFELPVFPPKATNNGHMFYLVFENGSQRNDFIDGLKKKGIHTVFHYLSLHSSPYFIKNHDGRILGNADKFSSCLVRLPFFYELGIEQQNRVLRTIREYFN